LVLSSSKIVMKPITIKKDHIKFLIPGKRKFKDVVNDPIETSFMSCVECPNHNSGISYCPGKRKFKDVVNDPIEISFLSLGVECPRHNSDISYCRKRIKSFKLSST
jgi:hypothetical protein